MPGRFIMRLWRLSWVWGWIALVSSGCKPTDAERTPRRQPAATDRPNILWVVWDTVRSDRMSLYGHDRPTTPRLETWATGARVFDNCISTAGSTVPSHASMFTGLLPSEHDTNNDHQHLRDNYTTVAEHLRAAGYQTYLFAANPHISSEENFQQGFEVEEHPWSPQYKEEALRIVQAKVMPQDKSSELARKIRNDKAGPWNIKASGELALKGSLNWLSKRDADRPFFIFLNYMEAHRPFLPPESYRRKLIKPEHVERSYEVDRSWLPMWAYTFGLHEYTAEELEVMASTYDACLAELDDLFAELLDGLRAEGFLDNTVVILTSDHGEHLGEHHMLDHQYALFNPLLTVPLVVHYPPRMEPGRDRRPVSNFDLFPTVLELAGVTLPDSARISAQSLLNLTENRLRIAEYPSYFRDPIRDVKKAHPQWDPSPWKRTFRALFDGPHKYIWASDGKHELYDLAGDPMEEKDIASADTERASRLAESLEKRVKRFLPPPGRGQAANEPSSEQREMLKGLGYVGEEPAGSESNDEKEGAE